MTPHPNPKNQAAIDLLNSWISEPDTPDDVPPFEPEGIPRMEIPEGRGSVSNKPTEWWRDADFAYRGKSDGQQFLAAFARDNDGKRETVVVLCSDGDGPEHVFGGVQIIGDTITEIRRDK